jgi:NAD(P)-dependent dehydrogenase (short-subunit alcohol dehydrogenase family)
MTRIGPHAALVTGGGSGIGRALARALAAEGAAVVVADILQERADSVAAEIASSGGSALAVACDVSDRASVREARSKANAAFGSVSLLFANAGVTSVEALADLSADHFDWITEVNLWGVSNCLQEFLPDMIAARAGHVMATASTAGLIPTWLPYHVPYTAAKAGVIGMMLNLRAELSEARAVRRTVLGAVEGGAARVRAAHREAPLPAGRGSRGDGAARGAREPPHDRDGRHPARDLPAQLCRRGVVGLRRRRGVRPAQITGLLWHA